MAAGCIAGPGLVQAGATVGIAAARQEALGQGYHVTGGVIDGRVTGKVTARRAVAGKILYREILAKEVLHTNAGGAGKYPLLGATLIFLERKICRVLYEHAAEICL